VFQFFALGFQFLGLLRGFGFLGGAFKVQGEQLFQNSFIGQIRRPAVGGGDGGI